MDKNKAEGWDSISLSILKMGAEGIATSLTNLSNKCIDLEQWPDEWKMGKWAPVFKSEDNHNGKNYRPITVPVTVDNVFDISASQEDKTTP